MGLFRRWYDSGHGWKIWNPDEDNAVDLQEFQDCEGMSAQEIFEAYGRPEFPDGGCVWINVAPSAQRKDI